MLATLDPFTPDPITLRNRANAQHSTGPRSPEGKAIVSRNATKHGLLSNAIIATAFEQQADWEAHLADFLDLLDPRDHPEHVLAEHIAFLHWRRARLDRYETAAINAQFQAFEDSLQQQEAPTTAASPAAPAGSLGQPATTNPQPKKLTEQQIAARRALCELPEPKTMDRIMRYENQIAKDLERTQCRLDQLKATRAQRQHALAQRRSQAAYRSGTDPDLEPDTLMLEDPRLGRPVRPADEPIAPCDDDQPIAAATDDASAPPADAATVPAAASTPNAAAAGATALRAKQSQTAPGAGRPASRRHTAKRARQRHK